MDGRRLQPAERVVDAGDDQRITAPPQTPPHKWSKSATPLHPKIKKTNPTFPERNPTSPLFGAQKGSQKRITPRPIGGPMRSHNPTTPRRSSLGAPGSLAFIHPPLLRALCASAAPPPVFPGFCYKMCAFATTTQRTPPPPLSQLCHFTERTHFASAILAHSRNLPPKIVSKTLRLW